MTFDVVNGSRFAKVVLVSAETLEEEAVVVKALSAPA